MSGLNTFCDRANVVPTRRRGVGVCLPTIRGMSAGTMPVKSCGTHGTNNWQISYHWHGQRIKTLSGMVGLAANFLNDTKNDKRLPWHGWRWCSFHKHSNNNNTRVGRGTVKASDWHHQRLQGDHIPVPAVISGSGDLTRSRLRTRSLLASLLQTSYLPCFTVNI